MYMYMYMYMYVCVCNIYIYIYTYIHIMYTYMQVYTVTICIISLRSEIRRIALNWGARRPRHVLSCVIYAGDVEVLPINSN